jgi:hypothetical protein
MSHKKLIFLITTFISYTLNSLAQVEFILVDPDPRAQSKNNSQQSALNINGLEWTFIPCNVDRTNNVFLSSDSFEQELIKITSVR